LNIYPVKFYLDPTGATWEVNLKPALIERGKRFREICVAPRGSRMFDYNGLALSRGPKKSQARFNAKKLEPTR